MAISYREDVDPARHWGVGRTEAPGQRGCVVTDVSRTVFLEDHPHVLDTTDASPTPEDNLIRLDNQAALQRALEQLEAPLREALLLCDVEEVKYKDIAVILDIPIGTVMSRISRARRALRQLLQPQLGESL